VRTEGKLIRATKRVLISENPEPHTNPPPPRFMFGDHAIIADPERPLVCVRDDGEPVTAGPGERIELAPEEEDWFETYSILTARGELREREERAFYSWYATAGALNSGSTKSPLRNNLWRLPALPGDYPLWIIVRDGHGGTSACELTVTVE
jgi:hypothetical protein